MPFDIDAASPGDSDIVSQFPANERTNRATIEDWIATEHDTLGHHKIPQDTTTNRDGGTWSNGALFWNTTLGRLQVRVAGSWISSGPEFASGGTVALTFFMAAAPTGWTQNITVNDKVLRVVSSAGGGSGGSWTISGVTVDSHVLTIAELPEHFHDYTRPDAKGGTFNTTGGTAVVRDTTGGANSSSVGEDDGHTHGLTSDAAWRPAYINVIVCTKD